MHSITALHNEEGEREDKESIRYPVRLAKLQRKAGGGERWAAKKVAAIWIPF